jgi:hypothetical protein
MTKPMIRIHNAETNEVIDREMNAAEFKQYEADQEAQAQRKIALEAKINEKSALLERLGITQAEADLLLS